VIYREGVFLHRVNRFSVLVQYKGQEILLHMPNPGKLGELLIPGEAVLWEAKETPRTQGLLQAIWHRGAWVPLVSVRANEMARIHLIPSLFPQEEVLAEVTHHLSRFDFFLPGKKIFLEIKACTLVPGIRAQFPDAPSIRALKHMRELAALSPPYHGEVWFIIVHGNPKSFSPAVHSDPEFSLAMADFFMKENITFRAFLFQMMENQSLRFTREVKISVDEVGVLSHGGICLYLPKELSLETPAPLISSLSPYGPGSKAKAKRGYLALPIYSYTDPLPWWESFFQKKKGIALLHDQEFWDALLLWRGELCFNHPGDGPLEAQGIPLP